MVATPPVDYDALLNDHNLLQSDLGIPKEELVLSEGELPGDKVAQILRDSGIKLTGLDTNLNLSQLPQYASSGQILTDAGGKTKKDELGGSNKLDEKGEPIFHLDLKTYLGDSAEYFLKMLPENRETLKNMLKTLLMDNGKTVILTKRRGEVERRTVKEIQRFIQKLARFLSILSTKDESAIESYESVKYSLDKHKKEGIIINQDIEITFCGLKTFAEFADYEREEILAHIGEGGEISERYREFYEMGLKEIKKLEEQIKVLKAENAKLDTEIAQLDTEIAQLDTEIAQLEEVLRVLKSVNESLKPMLS